MTYVADYPQYTTKVVSQSSFDLYICVSKLSREQDVVMKYEIPERTIFVVQAVLIVLMSFLRSNTCLGITNFLPIC